MTTMEDIERLTVELQAICDEIDRNHKINTQNDQIIVKSGRKTWRVRGLLAKQIIRLLEQHEDE